MLFYKVSHVYLSYHSPCPICVFSFFPYHLISAWLADIILGLQICMTPTKAEWLYTYISVLTCLPHEFCVFVVILQTPTCMYVWCYTHTKSDTPPTSMFLRDLAVVRTQDHTFYLSIFSFSFCSVTATPLLHAFACHVSSPTRKGGLHHTCLWTDNKNA